MKTRYPISLLLLAMVPPAADAHEVWVERDGNGPARIYLGEPAEPLPEGGDPEFDKLKAPRLLAAGATGLTRKAGWLEATVAPGDVRVIDDAVFAPWGPDGRKQGVVYYARAGRSDPRTAMMLEIAPVAAGNDRFVLVRDGKPVAHAAVTVVSPDKWSKSLKTDAEGAITVPLREKGRYLLSAAQKDEGVFDGPQGAVATLHRITTTTFVVE